jgi:Zn-dependent peptidase ImmA (M78 family)
LRKRFRNCMQHIPANHDGPKFPPNPNHWRPERNGHSLRRDFDRPPDLQLDPFEIARRTPGVELLDRPKIEQIIGAVCASELYGRSQRKWSGFVVPVLGRHLVVINDTHAPTRQVATLTEELFHIRLGHQPSRIYCCPITRLLRREYSREVEHDAYWSAAAALVPYGVLREMIRSGATIESIAEHFCVSVALVQFRLNVTRLARHRSASHRT